MLSFLKRLLGPTGQRTGRKATFRPTLECLEGRDLPSITFAPSTGTLTARGDDTGTVRHDTFDLGVQNGKLQLRQIVGTTTVAQVDVYTTKVSQIVINGGVGDS